MARKSPVIKLIRAYDITDDDHGYRVLVDRIWPRGIKKEDLNLDAWLKELAPSTDLRKWFNHRPERWDQFRERYFEELQKKTGELGGLVSQAGKQPLLLIYAARDVEHNNAVALREFLIKIKR